MKQNLLAIFLLSIILLQSCCKKEGNGIDPTHDMDSIKAYAYFLPGTYWIYEDNRGNTDSVYVVSAGSGYDSTINAYYFISWWHSTFDTYDYKVEWNTTWTSYNPTRNKVFMTKTKPGDYVGEIILLEYPVVVGHILYWYNENDITTENYFEQFTVAGIIYQNVAKIHETRDITNDYFQPTNYYIAKNVGLVQEDLLDSNIVWKLTRKNVIQ